MKRWLVFGKELPESVVHDLYTQTVGSLLAALTAATMIGAYHIIFHM